MAQRWRRRGRKHRAARQGRRKAGRQKKSRRQREEEAKSEGHKIPQTNSDHEGKVRCREDPIHTRGGVSRVARNHLAPAAFPTANRMKRMQA